MTVARKLGTLVCILILTFVAGCRRSQPTTQMEGPQIPEIDQKATYVASGARGSAKITYQSNVRLVERKQVLESVVGMSSDGSTLLFEAPPPELQALKSGDILVVKGLFARKVVAVRTEGSQLAMLTTSPSLGEVIRNGHIELKAPLRFSSAVASNADQQAPPPKSGLLDLLVTPAFAQSPLERQGKELGRQVNEERRDKWTKGGERQAAKKLAKDAVKGLYSGWNTTYSVVPGKNQLDISLQMTKDVGGFKGLVTANGYLSDFDLSSSIDVNEGTLQRLETTYERINGVMNFAWEVGKETPGGYGEKDMIKLPAAVTIPLYQLLDGFPLFLEVSAAVIIQPVITGGQQFSQGAFRVTYDGAQGFRVKEGNIDSDGKVKGDIKFLQDRHLSALAPVGMVVNYAAPRVELSLNPYKALGEILDSLKDPSLYKQITEYSGIAQKAGNILDQGGKLLGKNLPGMERMNKLADDLKNSSGFVNNAANAMKSDAAAYIQLVTSGAVTNSGFSVVTPCTHSDFAIAVHVGASAQAFGQKVASKGKTIFETKLRRIDPPSARLCDY